MENPLISVIVPVYNAEHTLHRCIDSILQQSYRHFELLLVDDGSIDASGAICDQYVDNDGRVKVFHKTNGGVSSARNLALDNSSGDYITFCDSDDYVSEDWLTNYQKGFLSNMDLVIQGYTIIDRNGEKTTTRDKLNHCTSCMNVRELIVKLMSEGMYGFLWVKLFKSSIIRNNNLQFDEESRFREDEQFLTAYLKFVNTFNVTNREGYTYFLPVPNKNYKGNSYYSLPHIFRSLDVIFDNQLPAQICHLHYVNIKDMIVSNLLDQKVPDDYVLELYRRMIMILNLTGDMKNTLLNFFILHSKQLRHISFSFIRLVHCFTKL